MVQVTVDRDDPAAWPPARPSGHDCCLGWSGHREELAQAAVWAYDWGGRVLGALVANPDALDRTSGRLLHTERSQQVTLPARMTGSASDQSTRPGQDQGDLVNIWNVEGTDRIPPRSRTATDLVTLHFLRNALRRRWLVWATAALVGVLLASGWAWHAQSTSRATVTLLLAHDPAVDAGTAMATDVNLLDTRAVALAVIQQQGLDMTSAEFRGGVTAVPLTSQLLQLEVQAPDGGPPEPRWRPGRGVPGLPGEQLEKQADAVVEGYRNRIATMQEQVERLTAQYEALCVGTALEQSEAGDVFAERARILGQVSLLQQRIEDTSLNAGSIVRASHVVDPAEVTPTSTIKAYFLPIVTGLIGGLALGAGWVLIGALTSDRLRRRDEVALALAAPVRFSVGRLHRPWWWLLGRQARQRDVAALVDGLSLMIAAEPGRPASPSRRSTTPWTRRSS